MSEGRGFERLTAACAAVRARVLLASVAGVTGGAILALLLLSFLPASLREGRGSLVPLILFAGILGGAVIGGWLVVRGIRAVRPELLADEVDVGAGLGTGDVRGALELGCSVASARSTGLAALHRSRVDERLSGMPLDRLLPWTAPRWSRRLRRGAWTVGLALAALALSALARPRPTLSAARALSAPWRTAFPAPLPALEIRGASGAPRGRALELKIVAPGRRSVMLAARPPGEGTVRRELEIPPSGETTTEVGPIDTPTRVWIEDARGRTSDTLLVRPLEPLLVQDLRVQVEFPAYLGRDGEAYRGQVPVLVVPEGTTLYVTGETNLPLDEGSLRAVADDAAPPRPELDARGAGRSDVEFQVDGHRFGASWTPDRNGRWQWRLSSSASAGEAVVPGPIHVVVVPDRLPLIRLLFPSPDTTIGRDGVMPLVVDVEDDIGIRAAALRSWRSGLGADRKERREMLAPDPGGSRRVVFRHLLDRSRDELLPGDTLFYQLEAADGHPGRGPARSDVFLLRVPTFTEMSRTRSAAVEDLAVAAEALEETLESLSESTADASRGIEAETPSEGFEATSEARAALDGAEAVSEELAALDDDLAELRDAVAESSLADAELLEDLERLADRYEELRRSGLFEEMEALAEALQNLDPEALREALESLADRSEALREQVEQSLGMLEQAALEQAVESARMNANELAEAQRELAEASEGEAFEEEQRALADRTGSLSESLSELERGLDAAGREVAADSAGAAADRSEAAIERMREAGEAARGDPGGEPSDGGSPRRSAAEDAAEALEQAASALGSAQRDLSGERREDAVETLGRARTEALSLAEEEGRLADDARGAEPADPERWRARQGAVRQGLENLLERLSEAGNEAAMLDQTTGAAAGEALARMDRLLERLVQDGAARLPSRAEAEGVQEALNALALELLARETIARTNQSSSPGEQAAEQLARMARQQQAITQETSSLLMPGPTPAGRERTRERLARWQQQVAEELDRIEDPEDDLLARPEDLAREAADLARRMELSTPTQETLERQRRLFRRMLDAGRSLEDEDLDPSRRESRTGEARAVEPPPIDPALLRGRRFPLPPESVLRELPPHYRALVFEYFDRLNRTPAPEAAAGRRDP